MSDPVLIVLIVAVIVLSIATLAITLRLASRAASDRRAEDLRDQMHLVAAQQNQQVESLRAQLQQMQGQMQEAIQGARTAMDQRLDGAARVIQNVSRQLGQLDESSKKMMEIGRDVSRLQDLLRAPKLRGNLGELFLGDLLSQILPPDHFALQHTFGGGERVDAVIRLHAGIVPVDAKFPLENFRRVVETESDDERRAARRQFAKDVKLHIDAIAKKYIRPDEGTLPFALMYIPAENVYYETIIKPDEPGGDTALFEYALQRRVIPVSPNSFYAYLQTILLGLKGLRVEESARELLNQLDRFAQEFQRFAEDFRLVGEHIDRSQKKFEEAQKRFGRVEARIDLLDGTVKGIEGKPPELSAPS